MPSIVDGPEMRLLLCAPSEVLCACGGAGLRRLQVSTPVVIHAGR